MKEEFACRLKKAMDIRNIKASELSEKAQIPKSAISQYLSGLYEAKQKSIFKLAKALDVSEGWLMGLDVPMENKNNFFSVAKPIEKYKVDNNVFPIPDVPIQVPVIGKISAGLPILAVENIIDYAFAPSSQIKKWFKYFYLIVEGDSMNQKFQEGNIVLVQQQDDLENDEIGVILIDDDATVKKYKKENGLVILQPMSNNPKNQIQIYNPKEKRIKIIGKIISYQGKV